MGMTLGSIHFRGGLPEELREDFPYRREREERTSLYDEAWEDLRLLQETAKRFSSLLRLPVLACYLWDEDALVLTLYKRGRRAAECMATANDEIAGKPVHPEVMASAFGTDDPKGAALQKLMTDEDPDEPEDMMERIEALSAYFDFPLVPDREISDRMYR